MADPARVMNRVREVRTRRSLTQEELAQRVGLTRQSVISIENGRYLPGIETALRLSSALGTRLDQLFWLEEKDDAT